MFKLIQKIIFLIKLLLQNTNTYFYFHSKLIMKIFFISLIILFFVVPFSTQAQVSEQEYQALVAFYKSTNGDKWHDNTGWDITQNPKKNTVDTTWHGVTTDMNQKEKSKITKLYFFGNNLTGKIPSEIGNLIHLDTLYLAVSDFKTIPLEIAKLTNLKYLHLASNKLEHFPPQLLTLKNLTSLSLRNNKFDVFPVGVTNIKSLKKTRY